MRTVLFIFGAALVALATASSHEEGLGGTGRHPTCSCGWANRDSGRIVNGKTTKQFEYPMVAGIVRIQEMKLFCGGTVISQKHVLTAAHCLDRVRAQLIGIHVGSHSYERVKWNHNLFKAQSITIHPQWNRPNLVYDIALITIQKQFWNGASQIGANIGPACLPRMRMPLMGHKVKVLGWGHLYSGGPGSPDLRQVNLDVKAHEVCHKFNPRYEKRNIHQICTFTEGKDSCQGDSGGPLLWVDKRTNRYTLVAATSYGVDCAKYPAVNTDVAYFMDWIRQEVAKAPGANVCTI